MIMYNHYTFITVTLLITSLALIATKILCKNTKNYEIRACSLNLLATCPTYNLSRKNGI